MMTLTASSDASAWTALGEALTALAALGTLVWAIFRDRSTDKETAKVHEEAMTGAYLKRSLDAFDDLVKTLQNEVARLTKQRDDADKAAREREVILTRELGRLRTEVRLLREELHKNGIVVPDLSVWAQQLDTGDSALDLPEIPGGS